MKITKCLMRVLFEINARIFAPTSSSQTFHEQFLQFNSSDNTRRGDIFELFTRNADTVMDISPKRCSAMDIVWKNERSCPNRRLESATMTESASIIHYQRIFGKNRALRVRIPHLNKLWKTILIY